MTQKTFQSIFFDCLFDVVIVLTAYAQSPTGVADVSQCLAKLKYIELSGNDMLSLCHSSSSLVKFVLDKTILTGRP
jgi:hypothetical protein